MNLLIIGGSTLGITVAEIAKRTGVFNVEGFVDDSPENLPPSSASLFWGKTNSLSVKNTKGRKLIIAVGNNKNRQRLFSHIFSMGLESSLVNIIDPAAIFLGDVSIGCGSVIFPGAIIGPQVAFGKCVLANANSFIGAMSNVGSFTNICPGASIGSSTCIGDGTYIGMRASIIQNLNIAPDVVIGAGASVITNLNETGTFAGTPARQISLN
ncbi:NeuD/PglB/VioB family sugar acetyltransferase [Ferribacterium limneticum]|uniref:NeuD/PglB/VioB family sugar acetyltransferase n=1 Tax=Ferribacterium limneticum TaxID=76259 RepID=UPI001CF84F10|nr:NeuD/PglB/VioB family sugar acetyltransferase [Ferribacterium limneticum]UCV24128.1 NeuD/PglB/VioB family sugar acetyltransferase [Ferribacterium limneticum]